MTLSHGLIVASIFLSFPIALGQAAKDEIESIKSLAAKGDANAQAILGQLYAIGYKVIEDDEEAVKWLRKAAVQGNMEAQHGLGRQLMAGDGVEKNVEEGMKWLRKAAEQGHEKSQFGVGLAYAAGKIGQSKDLVAAYMWLNLASASGEKEAKEMKSRVTREMTKKQVAEAQKLTRQWLDLHEAKGDPEPAP